MEVHSSVTEFFHGAVTDALKRQQVEATEPTEFYLVNLLCAFTHAANLNEEPLALRMARLVTSAPEERVRTLRDIGDTSLYVSGFFGDSLTRRLIDVDYYMAMGESAYRQLAAAIPMSRGPSPGVFRQVFSELSAKFAMFVEVLYAIRQKTSFTGSGNLLRLYEEWLRTGSEWLEKRLRETGLLAVESFQRGRRMA